MTSELDTAASDAEKLKSRIRRQRVSYATLDGIDAGGNDEEELENFEPACKKKKVTAQPLNKPPTPPAGLLKQVNASSAKKIVRLTQSCMLMRGREDGTTVCHELTGDGFDDILPLGEVPCESNTTVTSETNHDTMDPWIKLVAVSPQRAVNTLINNTAMSASQGIDRQLDECRSSRPAVQAAVINEDTNGEMDEESYDRNVKSGRLMKNRDGCFSVQTPVLQGAGRRGDNTPSLEVQDAWYKANDNCATSAVTHRNVVKCASRSNIERQQAQNIECLESALSIPKNLGVNNDGNTDGSFGDSGGNKIITATCRVGKRLDCENAVVTEAIGCAELIEICQSPCNELQGDNCDNNFQTPGQSACVSKIVEQKNSSSDARGFLRCDEIQEASLVKQQLNRASEKVSICTSGALKRTAYAGSGLSLAKQPVQTKNYQQSLGKEISVSSGLTAFFPHYGSKEKMCRVPRQLSVDESDSLTSASNIDQLNPNGQDFSPIAAPPHLG
jgi:hypothetical protein